MTANELREEIKRQYCKKSKEELLEIFADFLIKMVICYANSGVIKNDTERKVNELTNTHIREDMK